MVAMTGCQKQSADVGANHVEFTGQPVQKKLVSDGVEFQVISKSLLKLARVADEPAPNPADPAQNELVLGFPRELIGQQNVFGGVITAVSDTKSEELGNLKLSDLPAIHVTTSLSADGSKMILNGCTDACDEWAARSDLFEIPVVKQDAQFVYLDLKAFGSGLDIIQQLAPQAGISALETKVMRFDFSLSTLVFDVQNTYALDAEGNRVDLTTRWYLKLASGFNPDFQSRKPRSEVGFFPTTRARGELITRFSGSNRGKAIAKYYIKNVPQEYRQAFADALADWNKNVNPVLGRDILEWEFLDAADPRYDKIITGDVRYNVLEWDLVNKAAYGGLGPSIANQMTGEIFSANTLVQGPKVVEMYSKWWKVAAEAKKLELAGHVQEADKLRADFAREAKPQTRAVGASRGWSIQFSQTVKLPFRVPATDPRLRDPVLSEFDFYDTPAGYSYETYMYGYFRDMVSHEIGHNLGLRHNFRGNLGGDESGKIGTVSRSIMEYLGRTHRHLDRVGPYDVMAISYGYKGAEPQHADWFCTDENKVSANQPGNSAECSSNDAGPNPFGFFVDRFQRVKDFLILPGTELAPVWNVEVLKSQITPLVSELANYFVSSFHTAGSWTNFSTPAGAIPKEQVPGYILGVLAQEICDPAVDAAIALKTPEAQVVAQKNRADLFELVKTTIAPYKILTPEQLTCLK